MTTATLPALTFAHVCPRTDRFPGNRGKMPELTAELHRVKSKTSTSPSGGWLDRAPPIAARVSGAVQAMCAMTRSVAVRQRSVTVAVSVTAAETAAFTT